MHTTVRGLVIRAVDYKEADRILTVLTEEMGKITVGARGVRRKNAKHTFSVIHLFNLYCHNSKNACKQKCNKS